MQHTAMNPRMKGCLVLVFLLSMFLSEGIINGLGVGANPIHLLQKGGVQGNSRKLLGLDAALDYDDAGANPRHEPRGRRGGGRNP